MRRALHLAGLLLLLLGLPSCTTDDSVIDDKHCSPLGADPNQDCVAGYECQCDLEECLCLKPQTSALRAAPAPPPSAARASSAALAAEACNRRFLRQLGLQLAPP